MEKLEKDLNRKGRYITLLLRHKPEKENLDMDKNGWVEVKQLLSRLSLSKNELDIIVDKDNKTRFSYSSNELKIRCNQGHSIDVDVELLETQPPDILYHGTAWKSIESIYKKGITKQSRLYVHLSDNLETAGVVGKRHGSEHILIIDSFQMFNDGIPFYLSKNGVWLTDYIDIKYIIK